MIRVTICINMHDTYIVCNWSFVPLVFMNKHKQERSKVTLLASLTKGNIPGTAVTV